jgi:hypothetical protein
MLGMVLRGAALAVLVVIMAFIGALIALLQEGASGGTPTTSPTPVAAAETRPDAAGSR